MTPNTPLCVVFGAGYFGVKSHQYVVRIFAKALLVWFVIVLVAIVNGVMREKMLVPLIGSDLALPVSGVSLGVLVFVVSFIFVPRLGPSTQSVYIAVGLFWVVLTLLFEGVFGYFVVGKTWAEIMQVFDVRKGDLFVLVLAVTAVSPWLAARVRGLC